MSEFRTVGKSEIKIDVKAKVTGRAVYAADINLPGTLHAKIVRCYEHAHAKVKSLDLSAAAKMPGVVKVFAPEDLTTKFYNQSVIDIMVSKDMRGMLGDIEDQKILTDHVKHYGDGIAAIVATSEEAAERASERIKVEYEPLPVYLNAAESSQEGAVQFTPQKPGNMAFELPEPAFPNNTLGWGDADEGFKEADIIVEDNFYTSKQKQAQMEPNSYIALFDDDGLLSCWTSTQMPKSVQPKIAKLFNLPMSRVRIIQTVVGGGFGARLGMVLEPHVCALAMALPGRPIKVQSPREEDWLTSPSRHPGDYWMKMGFKKDGTPVACDAKFVNYKGGYYLDGSGVAFTTGGWVSGLYKFGALRYKGESYFTNQPVCGAYRGYGNPQTNFVLEQLVDRACHELNIDPVEWRKKWHKDVGDDGWCAGVPYASCALDEVLDEGAKAIDWKAKRERYAKQSGVKRRGVGVAVMVHTSGAMPMLLEHTVCSVRLNEDATAVVAFACSDMGQGSHTTLRQIAAETLGFPLEDVSLSVGDSNDAGYDIGAHASRTLYVGGGAVMAACKDALKQLLERAATLLEANPDDLEIEDKQIFVKGSPDRKVAAAEICSGGVYPFLNPQTGAPESIPGQILGYSSFNPMHNSPPFGACFVELEVDTETGEIKLIEMVNGHDIGRAINPAVVEGQLEGGAQQGLGMALTEELYFDTDGKVLNNSFTDYKMLGPSDMPKITNIIIENPDPHGPFGAKSVGEAGLVAPVGATANAIYNAIGIQITELPITPEKILKALNEKRAN
ncbi:MAG: molybdopterin cofactor-binding domain-containing protein [Candidatus Thiodiazotropha endolucinida]